MGPTSTLTGSQLPGGAISSPSSQPSNIFGLSSGSSESQESNSAFQASQSSETSNTVDAGTRTVPTQLSNNNHPGLQTTSQTMPLASQSMGSSQNPDKQLSRTMPISSQPSNATRGPISTQNPSYNISQSVSPTPSQSSPTKSSFQSLQLQSDLSTTADSLSPSPTQQMPRQSVSAKMSNAVATANTIDRVTSSEQSTILPSEVSSAGAVISQRPKSSPSTNPVVYATEPFISASRQSLAAATSNDTSFLDLGTSPPGTTSQSILAWASQSITSSPTHRTSVAPVTTGGASTNNGGNSEPAVNMPAEHGVNGELGNAALKSSNMPHAGPGSQDTNNSRPISGENRDQKQNKSSHRVHSAADQKSSETLSHDNAGDQRFQAVQLQLPQPANPNTGGSWGSPAAQMQPTQPASVNKGGRSRPATHPNHYGLTFTPIISNPFNFYGGALFDPASNSMTSGSDRMTQAREINANLPPSIQNALNDNSINYYHPGIGDFYYSKVCGDAGCSIVQVAISCNCYVDGADQQLHYLRVNQVAELKVSTFKNDTRLPPATQYLIKPGDTLLDIAVRYGAGLSLVLAANPAILKPDLIFPCEVIRIPAQAYMIVKEDYLYKIAKAQGASLSVIEALNDQIDNPDLIFPGQIIKVPTRKFGTPFCTTVEPGDSLFSISNNLGVTLSYVEAVNPHIKDKNLIFPKQILNVPVYLPAQGNLTSHNFCPACEMNKKNALRLTGAKFASAAASPKLVVTTIEVGPTAAPIIAKAPYQRSSLNNSWVEKASWKLFRLI